VDEVANPVQHRHPCQNDGVLQTLVYNDESWRLEAGAWELAQSKILIPAWMDLSLPSMALDTRSRRVWQAWV